MRTSLAILAAALATSVLAQAPVTDKPLVEPAPVVGWGDYVWLLPFVAAFIIVAAWYILRRRRRRF